MTLDFFTKYVLPPLIILFGLFGNAMGLKVVSRKALKNIGSRLIYKFLFVSDFVYLSKYFYISL
jgi:hypothetical protein